MVCFIGEIDWVRLIYGKCTVWWGVGVIPKPCVPKGSDPANLCTLSPMGVTPTSSPKMTYSGERSYIITVYFKVYISSQNEVKMKFKYLTHISVKSSTFALFDFKRSFRAFSLT